MAYYPRTITSVDPESSPISRAAHEAVYREPPQLLTLLRVLPDISFVLDEHGVYLDVIGGYVDLTDGAKDVTGETPLVLDGHCLYLRRY